MNKYYYIFVFCTGKTMDLHTIFHKSSFNILYLVLFGSRYDYGDNFLKFFILIFTENVKITNGPWAMVLYQFNRFITSC